MAKKQGKKCEHGNSAVWMNGCAECVHLAMGGLHLMRALRCTPTELLLVLHGQFKGQAEWDAALAEVRASQPKVETEGVKP